MVSVLGQWCDLSDNLPLCIFTFMSICYVPPVWLVPAELQPLTISMQSISMFMGVSIPAQSYSCGEQMQCPNPRTHPEKHIIFVLPPYNPECVCVQGPHQLHPCLCNAAPM